MSAVWNASVYQMAVASRVAGSGSGGGAAGAVEGNALCRMAVLGRRGLREGSRRRGVAAASLAGAGAGAGGADRCGAAAAAAAWARGGAVEGSPARCHSLATSSARLPTNVSSKAGRPSAVVFDERARL